MPLWTHDQAAHFHLPHSGNEYVYTNLTEDLPYLFHFSVEQKRSFPVMWLRLKMMADVSTCSPAFHPLHPQKEGLASLVRTPFSAEFDFLKSNVCTNQTADCQSDMMSLLLYIHINISRDSTRCCIHILYVMLTVYAYSANLLAWNYLHRLQIIPNDVSARLQVETLQNTVPTQKWCTREASPSFSGWRGCHAGLVTQGCRQWQNTR